MISSDDDVPLGKLLPFEGKKVYERKRERDFIKRRFHHHSNVVKKYIAISLTSFSLS